MHVQRSGARLNDVRELLHQHADLVDRVLDGVDQRFLHRPGSRQQRAQRCQSLLGGRNRAGEDVTGRGR